MILSAHQVEALTLEALVYADLDTFLAYFENADSAVRNLLKQRLERPLRDASSDIMMRNRRREMALGYCTMAKEPSKSKDRDE